MPEYVIVAFIGVGGATLGAIVGSFISYKYSFGLIKKTKLVSACIKFKIAFLPVIYDLDNDNTVLSTLIDESIPQQKAAFWELLAQLKCKDRDRFYKDWDEYEKPDKEMFPESVRLSYGCAHPDEREGIVKKLHERIGKLVEYAENAS